MLPLQLQLSSVQCDIIRRHKAEENHGHLTADIRNTNTVIKPTHDILQLLSAMQTSVIIGIHAKIQPCFGFRSDK